MSLPSAATFTLTLAAGALLALAACQVAPLDERDTSRPDGATSELPDGLPDAATDTGGGLVFCDPSAVETGCAPGLFCETTAYVCVECVGRRSRCGADGVREVCEPPVATGVGQLTGGFFEPDPCGAGEACLAQGITAGCAPIICEPHDSYCVDSRVLACNATGTAEELITCQPGRACYEGACEFIRHNVLLIFDTSGSMYDYIDPEYGGNPSNCQSRGTPCLQPFPACDDPEDPLILITLAKNVFAESIRTAIGGFSQFALQRFPQREAGSNAPNCLLGWYTVSDPPNITGDDDAWATEAGGWFDQNMREAIVVPFPVRANRDNQAEILMWLDHVEALGATDTPCQTHADCDGGRCGVVDGDKRCFHHTQEELRVGGRTPLGKSLFYAGEYFRRFVAVDGKPCTRNAECGSAGYVCRNERCVDPYRHCRDNFIILFTDGEETEYQSEGSFFNPVVQAKRLAHGLDCASDEDCRGGATCKCVGAECTRRVCDVPGWSVPGVPPSFDSGGYGALSATDGAPLSVRTTVLTFSQRVHGPGPITNARIAAAGGGAHLDIGADDPSTFQQLLIEAMTPDFKCEPEDLEGLDP